MHTEREIRMIDIDGRTIQAVEVSVQSSVAVAGEWVLHVNVDGICRLRIGGLTNEQITLYRQRNSQAKLLTSP